MVSRVINNLGKKKRKQKVQDMFRFCTKGQDLVGKYWRQVDSWTG